MNQELIQHNITVKSAEIGKSVNGKTMVRIKDENNLTYMIWGEKKDGAESVAYNLFKMLPDNGIGQTISISYREEPFSTRSGGTATSRTIVNIGKARASGTASKVARSGMSKSNYGNSGRDWNKEAFGKCKHAYLLEAFKHIISSDNLDTDVGDWEEKSEQWARASMRVLEESQDSEIQYNSDNYSEDGLDVPPPTEEYPF